jgi:hypothetical protein
VELEAHSGITSRWWDDVDRLLAALPPALFRQVKLLEYDLALRYSRTGQFHNIFSGPDHPPVLSVATWLMRDLEIPSSATRDEAERRLFGASVLLAARVQTVEGLHDPGGFTTEDRIALVQWLSERAAAEIARVVPSDSPYWDAYEAIAGEDATRLAAAADPDFVADTGDDPEAHLASPFSAPLRTVALAALAAVDRLEGGTRVAEMLEQVAHAYQAIADLASMHRDLELGRVSYPIAFIARAARIPLRPAPRPEVILGAMVVTGSLRPIVETAFGRLRSARYIAVELRLPTFSAFLSDAEAHFEAQLESWTLGTPRHGSARPAPAVRQSMPTLSQALGMAEGFLLADPTFRESWETHREGMLGRPEVASRFPAGLILEILCRRGLDVRKLIDEFLAFTVANGFRYYDHPRSGVDSDTIGVFLRLRPHATVTAENDRVATLVLECLARNVQQTGAIPVWLTGCADPEESAGVIALGEGCGTVAAHLLLGLVPAPGEHEGTVTIGAKQLLDRIGSVGVAANINYPPLYALGAFFRLVHMLDAANGPVALGGIGDARAALTAELERVVSTSVVTAQDAALLILACHEANREDLIDPGWLVQVLKRQRFDGSWIGEPFAAAPNRGRSVSWYSSTLLTTALCYDALGRGAKGQPPATD